jgi:hypothetical protein
MYEPNRNSNLSGVICNFNIGLVTNEILLHTDLYQKFVPNKTRETGERNKAGKTIAKLSPEESLTLSLHQIVILFLSKNVLV